MQDFTVPEVPVKSFITVDVIEPITITVQENAGFKASFTSFLVKVKTNHWAFASQRSEVRRRYSEFLWLRARLQEHYPDAMLPKLPPKRYLHLTQFNAKMISDRCAGLQNFLQQITQSVLFISDPAVLMFLQTNLGIEEMDCELRRNSIKGIHTNASETLGRRLSDGDSFKSDFASSCGSIYSGYKSTADIERELDDHEAKLGFISCYENPDNLV